MPGLVEQYATVLQAPHKHIVWFERSGHSPSFEEPERFNELMLTDVLSHVVDDRRSA